MDDQEGMDPVPPDGRWTCEACGCNTNSAENPVACNICGTRRIPAFLRRAGRSAASRLFANHYGLPRGAFQEDQIFDEEGLEIQFEDAMPGMEADEQAVAALALQVAGVTGAARMPSTRSTLSRRQRFPNAPNGPPNAEDDNSNLPPPDPPEILSQLATENASAYQPKWATSSQLRGRARSGHDVELGTGEFQNVARIPDGAAEGRAIRAFEPFPRAPVRSDGESSQSQRKVFGFRVVFHHPLREPGTSLGDCYLVGITTSSFSGYGDRNGLMQSPYFWGIEDCGNKYEGPRRTFTRSGARPSAASYGVEMSASQAPRNSDNVLFGSRETVTVVVDLDNRSMSFWRDDVFLGTLVRNLPRSGHLYPVVVPFNPGAAVAISGMDGAPLPRLNSFISSRDKREVENAKRRRQQLAQQTPRLIQNGRLSPELVAVLKNIFFLYSGTEDVKTLPDEKLDIIAASRLWYRSGLLLSDLRTLITSKFAHASDSSGREKVVSVNDFIESIGRVVVQQGDMGTCAFDEKLLTSYEVGDMVELAKNYEKLWDAADGPLQPGDRGQVVEVKKAVNDETFAIRVSHAGRHWWYHPQALVSERSGLIESRPVWFLHKALRAHGYDYKTLEPLWGKPIGSTWEVGDIVVPEKNALSTSRMVEDDIISTKPACFGRIVGETKNSLMAMASRGRNTNTVLVEFTDASFGKDTGAKNYNSNDETTPSLQVCRVPISKLVYGGPCFDACHKETSDFDTISESMSDAKLSAEQSRKSDPKPDSSGNASDSEGTPVGGVSNLTASLINSKLRAEIEGVSCLDPTAMQSIARVCEKQTSLSNGAFTSSLCDAILSGVSMAEDTVIHGKVHDSMRAALSSLGYVSGLLCDRILSSENESASPMEENMNQDDEDQEAELSHSAAGSPHRDRVSESGRTAESLRAELSFRSSRRVSSGAASSRDRGHMFRTRARHVNSTGSRSPREELNSSGGTFNGNGTRAAVQCGLLMNSLPWVKATLDLTPGRVKNAPGSESPLSTMSNSRDEQGMPLLLLAITLGCSEEIVRHLVMSEANVGRNEVIAAAETDQPRLLSILLEHSVCPRGLLESTKLSSDVIEALRAADIRQKTQEEETKRKVQAFASVLIFKLCRLSLACRQSPSVHIKRLSRSVCEALVGNVLLRSLYENQQKALTAASPRRRKHGGVGHPKSDTDSERMSLAERGRLGDTAVYAPMAAMSPKHGVLLVLSEEFFRDSLFGDSLQLREERSTALFAVIESLLWSKDKDDAAVGLTILEILLKNIPTADICGEIVRYGLNELILAHELIAGRALAEIKRRLGVAKDVKCHSEESTDKARATKKRPRPNLAIAPAPDDGVVLCPKLHVAELHLTKHSSFRCDLCGKSVLRDRPMHGCRECDWDSCSSCTDEAEGGIVKWGRILELASRCSRVLDGPDSGLLGSASTQGMSIERDLDGFKSEEDVGPDFSILSRQLRVRDEDALTELASMMSSSNRITNHEFVSYILPALHESLVFDMLGAMTGKDSFCRKALEVFTCRAEDLEPREMSVDDDSHMSIEDFPSQDEDERIEDVFGQGRRSSRKSARSAPSGIMRRLQEILAFSENMRVLPALRRERGPKLTSPDEGCLEALTLPIELELSPFLPSASSDANLGSLGKVTVLVEPLLPKEQLQLHVLRTCRVMEQSYLTFCRSLAEVGAVIVEKPIQHYSGEDRSSLWQIAQVIGFDEDTGSHSVRYSSSLSQEMRLHRSLPVESIKFDGREAMLMLASRNYVIIRGDKDNLSSAHKQSHGGRATGAAALPRGDSEDSAMPPESSIPPGTRVEANCRPSDASWHSCTVISRSAGSDGVRYCVVSDLGEIFQEVHPEQIRGHRPATGNSASGSETSRGARDSMESDSSRSSSRRSGALPFPFFRMGQNMPEPRGSRQGNAETPKTSVLKRTWSAISPLDDMCPLNITVGEKDETVENEVASVGSSISSWRCSIAGEEVEIFAPTKVIQHAPEVSVQFGTSEMLPPVDISKCNGETVVHVLNWLQQQDKTRQGSLLCKKQKLFYNICCNASSLGSFASRGLSRLLPNDGAIKGASLSNMDVIESDGDTMAADECCKGDLLGVSKRLDCTSLQCMEVINVLATYAEEGLAAPWEENQNGNTAKAAERLVSFENDRLSRNLVAQLDDPLSCVGGLLPEWCLTAPSVAPRIFSYSSRRQLLLRTAFGVSRSTLKQQEAKVAVGPLRQRMTALRSRAVELMGEAFSGDVDDPTVHQLRADELYAMEDALSARVTAAFRAQRWQERSLQCAKAVVRREMLLLDAAAIMERYANDRQLCHRRLEVRFQNESGFDAASGDEAGVTRGFYADVAEALLSCDHVSAAYCPAPCMVGMDVGSWSEAGNSDDDYMSSMQCRLPLWIPDLDPSQQVVIPTPRASPHSTLGVYPRPLSPNDPCLHLVQQQFRFVGRLFAAAMRDGLMFPLQLSSSFLKLVQNPWGTSEATNAAATSSESVFGNNVSSIGKGRARSDGSPKPFSRQCIRATTLTSDDLPRPGFLGGDVYAVESHICAALDQIDEADPPLSAFEVNKRRQEIASDREFARLALGKTYDCSFEDYFQDRVFVDPLSPTQGEDAVPLCPNGHLRQVDIHNVREWVTLAKKFILYDGVMEQALAFRSGVEDFFPADYLSIFTARELQRDVCGGGDKVERWVEEDIKSLFKFEGRGVSEALAAVGAMGGGGGTLSRRFGSSSSTIEFLVRTLLESTPTQRRQFLSFVTSVPIETPGKIEVVPVVSPSGEFLPMRDPGCLPRANTCARKLYLPKFEDYESFSQVLWAVIREESKFKGFYEWRG